MRDMKSSKHHAVLLSLIFLLKYYSENKKIIKLMFNLSLLASLEFAAKLYCECILVLTKT